MMIDPVHKFQVKPWPAERLAAFELLEPVCLWVASADASMSVSLHDKQGNVKQRFGGNKPVWPIKLGLSAQYKDTVTPSLKNADSFTGWGLRWRVWVLDVAEANRLLGAAEDEMERTRVGPPLMGGRHDAGPDFWRMHRWCTSTVVVKARELGIKTWADDELGQLLDEAAAAAAREQIGQRPAEFRAIVQRLLSGQHALSRPRTKSTPRTPTAVFGIGVKQKPWAGDPEVERQIAEALSRSRSKVA